LAKTAYPSLNLGLHAETELEPTSHIPDVLSTQISGTSSRVNRIREHIHLDIDHSCIQKQKHVDHTYSQSMGSNSQIHLNILECVPKISSTSEIVEKLEVDTRQISREERGLEISEADLNEGKSEETEQTMTDEEICEEVEKEESLTVVILEPPSTAAKIKPDTAFNCINTCITWAEENGVSAKDIIDDFKMKQLR
ncbi:unnamed protein product, partial [Parnassius apollo]